MKISYTKLLPHLPNPCTKVGFYIYDFNTGKTLEHNPDMFIYPASALKIFIGAEVQRQIETNKLDADSKLMVGQQDKLKQIIYPWTSYCGLESPGFIEIRKLLKAMLLYSDNIATNVLADAVGLDNIQGFIDNNGWTGNGFTQKFIEAASSGKPILKRAVSVVNAKCLCDFMSKLEKDEMDFTSQVMKQNLGSALGRSASKSEKAKLNGEGHRNTDNRFYDSVYYKGGFLEAGSPRNFLKFIKNGGFNRWQAEAGVVKYKDLHYAYGMVSQYETFIKNRYFKFSRLQKMLEKYL
ncbi:MAG: class A beta-lactamase-related serine hydrolase [Rickettsiales bacterium]|jgi:hypothetical protein|nr:class A beta-lactamase-related serine hydrolase [Rickettsiales bacterium]